MPTINARTSVVVQTFGINVTKRRELDLGSCSENGVPDFGRPLVFDAKLSEFELTFSNPMHEFNTGDGDRGAPKPLQSKHWTQTKFDRSVILLYQVIQIFRGSNFGSLPALMFTKDFPRRPMRSLIAVERDLLW